MMVPFIVNCNTCNNLLFEFGDRFLSVSRVRPHKQVTTRILKATVRMSNVTETTYLTQAAWKRGSALFLQVGFN
jgi:hypothetical protein